MHFSTPDPHIGRCQNVRHEMHADSFIETLRCLGEEAKEHVCWFPPKTHTVTTAGTFTHTTTAPQKWVSPERTTPGVYC